jgi:Tol biopolymer transport system component
MGGWRVKLAILGALVATGVAAAQVSSGATSATSWIIFSAAPLQNVAPELHRIRTDGTGLKEITSSKGGSSDPAWSPDGKRIVFVRVGLGIYSMNVDGGAVRRLTKGARDLFPVYSPNGRRIAFLRIYKTEWYVFTMSPNGRNVRRLRHGPPAGRPSWTADGKSIWISSRGALLRVSSTTGRIEREVTLREDLPISSTLSPNTKQVAFVASRPSIPGCGEVSCLVFALYLGDSRTGRTKRFVNNTGPPGWSPDGKTLVFVYRHGIALWPVNGGSPKQLSVGSVVAAADSPPAWQP